MIDEVIEIEMIYDIKAADDLRKCKMALALFNITKLGLPNKHSEPFNLITTPESYFVCDTISVQNSVLELIQNLH